MIKKVITTFFTLFLISVLSVSTWASDFIETHLFPATIIINGKESEQNDSLPILNYNGNAYVPIRYFAENMQAQVGYDPQNTSIFIDYQPRTAFKSAIHSSKKEKDFELTIKSAKKIYSEGDLLQVFGEMSYTGDVQLTLNHPIPLSFYIKNSEGKVYGEVKTLEKVITAFNPGDSTLYDIPYNLITMYNAYESGVTNPSDYFNNATRPRVLPKGKYTIGVSARFVLLRENTVEQTINFDTEIPIEVE